MTRGNRYKKDRRQPSIIKALNESNKVNQEESATTQQIDNSEVGEKRRRETDSSIDLTSSPLDQPNQNDFKTISKKEKKKQKMSQTPEDPVEPKILNTANINQHNNHPDIKPSQPDLGDPEDVTAMERRLSQTMINLLKPIETSLKELTDWKKTMTTHDASILQLKNDNWKLRTEVTGLKQELLEVNERLNKLENKALDKNLIFHGILEGVNDNFDSRIDKVYDTISSTINRETSAERLQVAQEVEIIRTRRLGKKEPGRTRPLSVEFSNKYDAEQIFANRLSLSEEIYVNREYTPATERDRRLLRPILKAAKKLKDFKENSRLEGNQLVLGNDRYTTRDLHKLPRSLDIMAITTKKNQSTLGFFGELCPLSNFHHSPFIYNGVDYHSSEQLIQHEKAKYFNDQAAVRSILNAKTPLACKWAAKEINNYDAKKWASIASKQCLNGIEAKFLQNPRAMQALLETDGKRLIECSKDTTWGTGKAIHDPTALQWKHQGILGKLLEEIRDIHIQRARSLIPNPWSIRQTVDGLFIPPLSETTPTTSTPANKSAPAPNTLHLGSPTLQPTGETNVDGATSAL